MTVDRAKVEAQSTAQDSTPTADPTVAATSTLMPTVTPLPEIPPLPETECIPTATEREFATVLDVIDGDTIEVLIEGVRFRLRYISVDAPEVGEPFFNQATTQNAELVLGKTVTLIRDVTESDEEGSLLRYVLAGNTFVNYSLVREGFANAMASPPDVACNPSFAEAQSQAVSDGRGLWAVIPTPPAPTHTPASVPNIQITVIRHSGTVPDVESDEFVQITNQGSIAVNLLGWRLNAGELEQDFYFPDFLLDPGLSCRIYTDEEHPEHCNFSFRIGQEIWNNGGDCGYLYDDEGAQVSKYCY
jgi:endonuclease YncB( thermonuclease family)